MLHELFEPSTKIKMFDVYVNDVKLDYKVVNDFVIETEVEFNYFNMISRGFMRCAEELFTLSIKKHPSALTDDDSVKIIFQDNSGKIFERRYTILNCVKANCDYRDSVFWDINLVDVYGYALVSPNYNKYITQVGYKGTPIQIVKQAVDDLFMYPKNKSKLYNDKQLNIVVSRNDLHFSDNPDIFHRFTKDNTPFENIQKLCREYNILIYQDCNNFYITQNPKISNLTKPENVVYRENAGSNYFHKICDKIKQQSSISTDDRPNYKVSHNQGGKKQVIQELKFTDLLDLIELNHHESDEFRNSNSIYYSSSTNSISTLLYDSYRKYLLANNLVIYVRSIIDNSMNGTITSTQLDVDSNIASRRAEGDFKYSGYWLIRSVTFKIVKGHLITRLALCRYDNQKDVSNIENSELIGDKEQPKITKINIGKKSEYSEYNKLVKDTEEALNESKKNLDDLKRKKELILKGLR